MKQFVTKKNKSLRPTTGRVREALFDILRGKIKNARFLDLYAGTGAVGVDALGEGASEVVFVEESRESVKRIMDHIKKFHFSEKAVVVSKKVLSYIDWAELNHMTFDIIFLDPPYHTDEILQSLSAIGISDILDPDGVVIAEHFKKKQLPDKCEKLRKTKDYKYGDSVLSIYEIRITDHSYNVGVNMTRRQE